MAFITDGGGNVISFAEYTDIGLFLTEVLMKVFQVARKNVMKYFRWLF